VGRTDGAASCPRLLRRRGLQRRRRRGADVLATDTLGAGGSAVGLLPAGVGVGLLAGYALLARTRARVPMVALPLVGFAISSAGNLLTGLAGAVAAAFLVQAVRGLGIAGMDVAANTVLQRIVPPALLGRVFGSLYGAIGVAAALAYLLGGLLLDRTTPRITFIVAGAGGPAGHPGHGGCAPARHPGTVGFRQGAWWVRALGPDHASAPNRHGRPVTGPARRWGVSTKEVAACPPCWR
jgi:MFS family permease